MIDYLYLSLYKLICLLLVKILPKKGNGIPPLIYECKNLPIIRILVENHNPIVIKW